ncbi:hypothetical protein GCM10010052_42270 [Paenarthrobacter histidinolovorans]|nr:hypothetical protein [Paenarthrobacter histidinolovorans]GGJ40699.1 hypothetical protein GCM10010052_42270 [Paenarthrobacter histidinolovorans]
MTVLVVDAQVLGAGEQNGLAGAAAFGNLGPNFIVELLRVMVFVPGKQRAQFVLVRADSDPGVDEFLIEVR